MISPKARETLEAMTMEDCVELSKLLAAKLERSIAERARYIRQNSGTGNQAAGAMQDGSSPAPANLPPTGPDHCPGCGAAEFGPESDRVVIDWSSGAGVVEPCSVCRPVEHASFKKHQAEVDPWDLASEELNLTCPLPRETPAYYGRSREDYDEHDDKADILPHERTTR